MTKTQKILLGALVLQLGLAAATYLTTRSAAGASAARPFLGVKASDVTGLVIESGASEAGGGELVDLEKVDGQWVVASGGGFPAKADKVEELVKNLSDLAVHEPISTQPANHAELKVADAEFGRKVTLKTGASEKTFFVGSGDGPGVHLRNAGEPAVYLSRGISAWSVNASARNYVDTKYVEMEKDGLSAVTIVNTKGALTFKKAGDSWTLAELPEGEALDADKAKAFVARAAKLSLEAPIGKEPKPEFGLGSGAKVTLVGTAEGKPKTVAYLIGSKASDKAYYAKADDSDYVITASKYAAEQLIDKSVADFVKAKPKEEAPAAATASPEEAAAAARAAAAAAGIPVR
jgi:hypothetical protein